MIYKKNLMIKGSTERSILADLTFLSDNKSAPLIIFVHGFMGFKDWGCHHLVAQFFAEQGFHFLKFNFSHNGTTFSSPTEFSDLEAFAQNTFSLELDDLGKVIEFALQELVKNHQDLILLGHSLGGGISIIKTAQDPRITKLVTMASMSDFRKLWSIEDEESWRTEGVLYRQNKRTGQNLPLNLTLLQDLEKNQKEFDLFTQAAKIKQPWLIVHGEDDQSIPKEEALLLKKAQPKALLTLIAQADHTFGAKHPYFDEKLPLPLLEFCEKALSFLTSSSY